MWKELLDRTDLNSIDFVCEEALGIYRGPIKALRLDTAKGIFTVRTPWVAVFNPVTMRWIRSLPSPTGEWGIEMFIEKVSIDPSANLPGEGFVRFRNAGNNHAFAFLVPHRISKLRFEELV